MQLQKKVLIIIVNKLIPLLCVKISPKQMLDNIVRHLEYCVTLFMIRFVFL